MSQPETETASPAAHVAPFVEIDNDPSDSEDDGPQPTRNTLRPAKISKEPHDTAVVAEETAHRPSKTTRFRGIEAVLPRAASPHHGVLPASGHVKHPLTKSRCNDRVKPPPSDPAELTDDEEFNSQMIIERACRDASDRRSKAPKAPTNRDVKEMMYPQGTTPELSMRSLRTDDITFPSSAPEPIKLRKRIDKSTSRRAAAPKGETVEFEDDSPFLTSKPLTARRPKKPVPAARKSTVHEVSEDDQESKHEGTPPNRKRPVSPADHNEDFITKKRRSVIANEADDLAPIGRAKVLENVLIHVCD